MKLSEIRPCDACHGPLTGKGDMRVLQFYRVRVDAVFIDPRALQQVAGMHQYFGGKALGLAEMFVPDPEVAKPLSEHGAPATELLLCFDCYCRTDGHCLAGVVEMRNAVVDAEADAAAEKAGVRS